MAAGDAIRYGFAVGRVMVLRTRLLGRATFERLLDAPTFAEQKRVLSDTHFGRFLDGAETASDVERAVDAAIADLYTEFLEHSELPQPVIAYFRTPYDHIALKGALKAQLLGADIEPPSVRLGAVDPAAVGTPEEWPGGLGETARAVVRSGVTDPEALDAAVDAALFAQLSRLAARSRLPLLVRLAAAEADVANAKVVLRMAIAGRDAAAAAAMLVPGGSWDASQAARAVPDREAVVAAVRAARVLPAASDEDLLDLSRLDVLADAAVGAVAREAARGSSGAQPVLGYVLQRRSEAVTVRSVLVGTLAGLPRDVVAGRLREAAS